MPTGPHEIEASFVARERGDETLDAVAELNELAGFVLRRAADVTIHDRYFDTPERTLAGRRIALRLRESDGDTLLTAKGSGERMPTGGTRRLELERRWSAEALEGALALLAEAGVRLGPSPGAEDPEARRVLEGLGLAVVQERTTHRRVRLVTRRAVDRVVAEVDLDAVVYSFGDTQARLFEVEIEAKDPSLQLRPLLDALLREAPELTPWPHSKLATGFVLEHALAAGGAVVDASGAVSPLGWATLEAELGGGS